MPQTPVERMIEGLVGELRDVVDHDRALWDQRRQANIEFRRARLRLGYELNRVRREKYLTDRSFGDVLKGLGLNRHTAHQAMRLAAEFSTPEGDLDTAKLAAARSLGDGVLRATKKGQRALEAEPGRVTIKDLRRVLEAGRKSKGNPLCVDPGQHIGSGEDRAAGERAVRNDSAPTTAPTPPATTPKTTHMTEQTDTTAARAAGGVCTPLHPAGPGRGVSGEQLKFDFDAAAPRLISAVQRVQQTVALAQSTGRGGIDPAALNDFAARCEALADTGLSLLRGGAA